MTNASCYWANSFQQYKTISRSQWFQIQINIWLFKPHRKERRLIRMCLKSLEPPASNQWSYTPKHFLRSVFMDVFLNFLCLAVRRKTSLKSTIVQNTVKQMHAICGFLRLPFRWQLTVSVIWQICVPKRYHPRNQKQGWYMYICAQIIKETVAQL